MGGVNPSDVDIIVTLEPGNKSSSRLPLPTDRVRVFVCKILKPVIKITRAFLL